MLLPLLLLAGCAQPPPRQPNLVLVLVDTLRADHLGAYGYDRPTSPHIDALGARGAVFTRAYSQAGWTLASVASLFTGTYPHTHRAVWDAQHPQLFGEVSLEATTLAEALSAAGYATAAFVNNPFLIPALNLNQGFELYDIAEADSTHIRSATDTVAQGLAWLDDQKKPAFLVLHFMEPHMGYDPAPDVRGSFAPKDRLPVPVPFVADGMSQTGGEPEPAVRDAIVALYDEEILSVDKAMGELVAGLDQRDAWGKTTLVFTADHGEEFWDHGGFEHAHTLYGELVRVPLILAGLGAPKGRFDTVVEQLDLFQGLLARGGAKRPADSLGTDLWTLATPEPVRGRYALSETVVGGGDRASITDENTRLVVLLDSPVLEAWKVDAQGGDREPVPELDQREVGRPLFRELFDRRGGLDAIVPNPGKAFARGAKAEQLKAMGYQLRSLGYVEGPE